MKSLGSRAAWVGWALAVCIGLAAGGAGCKRSGSGTGATAPPSVVTFSPTDVNPDGSIKQPALDQLAAKAEVPGLHVTFIRSTLNDKGLVQLAGYPNIKKVEAIGSPITQAGIDKLKASLPEVEVVK